MYGQRDPLLEWARGPVERRSIPKFRVDEDVGQSFIVGYQPCEGEKSVPIATLIGFNVVIWVE
jgi:hypothetical protein